MKSKHIVSRLLSLLLVCAMLAGLFAGCAGEQGDVTESTEDAGDRLSSSTGETVLTNLSDRQRLNSLVTRAEGAAQTKEYTIMVYIVGSNLESTYGCASSDLLEMLNSGLDGGKCNLVVCTGGSKSWELEVPSDCNTVWALTEDGTELEMVAATEAAANMGDPGTFLDFLNYAYENYPAEHYGLICWDHGGGPLWGYGSDELYGNDGLSLTELDAAMSESPFAGEKLDFMGFDACLMASIEVADLFADYADYLIASEETEPGTGWDYSFLSVLNTTSDTEALAAAILAAYEASMESNRFKPEYTLSCIDLSRIEALTKSLETVYAALGEGLASGNYNAIAQSRNDTKRFALSTSSGLSSSYDLVDLGDLLGHLEGSYETQVKDAIACLDTAVVAQVTNLEGANGLSIYFPYDNKTQFRSCSSQYTAVMDYENYGSFFKAFTDYWLCGETEVSWDAGESVTAEEGCLTVTLTQEQRESVASVTYTVLEYDAEKDVFYPILANMQAEADSSGVISIPRNPDIFLMHTDIDETAGDGGSIWPVTLTQTGGRKNSYVVTNGELLSSSDVIVGETENIRLSLSHDPDSGEVEIQSILSVSDDAVFFGKQDVDIANYGCVAYFWQPLYTTFGADGELLPWDEWSNNGWYTWTYMDYEEDFWLTSSKLWDTYGQFYCQITLTDTCGNVIGTHMEELYSNIPYETVELAVAGGCMTFAIYEERVEVTGFTPDNADYSAYGTLDLTIPATVKGKPVVAIGTKAFYYCSTLRSVAIPDSVETIYDRAFSGCWYLEEVKLPDSLKRIDSGAFRGTALASLELPEGLEFIGAEAFAISKLTEIDLPESVAYVSAGAFYGCENLTAINARGSAYKSVDGVLFTADGRRLVAYPGGGKTEYTVPAGVEVIGTMAFRYVKGLTGITFNEGLKEIGLLAFCDTMNLTAIELPDSLERIGNGAFAAGVGMDTYDNVETISIGANVSWIGREAFSGYRMRQILVDEGNEYYSSANGCLLNKSGTRLIQAPIAATGTLVIPDGVSYIDWDSLSCCSGVTELVIPDSVVSISHAAGVPENLEKVTIGSGLSDWQWIFRYNAVGEIVISGENEAYTVVDNSIYSKDMTTLYACRSTDADFVIPDGVTTIASGAFYVVDTGRQAALKSVTIPASVTSIPAGVFSDAGSLESITVDSGNSVYCSYDGLLYSKDGTILHAIPNGKTGTVEIRSGTLEIAYRASYSWNLAADTVIIPEGVAVIRDDNFVATPYGRIQVFHFPASLMDIHPDMMKYFEQHKVEIHAPAGSAVEAFAEGWGLTVIND